MTKVPTAPRPAAGKFERSIPMHGSTAIRALLLCSIALWSAAATARVVVAQTDPAQARPQRGPAISGLNVTNLDLQRSATFIADMYPEQGAPPITINRPGIAPGASTNVYIPSESTLRFGRYAGIVASDRPVASIVRTEWQFASDAAAYSHAHPGRRHIVPVFSGFDPRPTFERAGLALRHHSVVHVQNIDPSQSAVVALRLRDAAARSIGERAIAIAPGGSVSLDQVPDSLLRRLDFGAIGSLELISEMPIAVASHVGLEPWPTAAMGFESAPVELADRRLFAPLISSSDWSSRIVLINAGDAPADIQVEYRANADASGDRCPAGPIVERPGAPLLPRSTLMLDQSPRMGSPLGEDCWASASIQSDQALIGFVWLLHAEQRTAAAYRLKRSGEAGRRIALPLVRHRHTALAMSTAIQLQNPGSREVQVDFEILDASGDRIDCPACSGRVPAGGSRLWSPAGIEDLDRLDGFWGSAQVSADGPVLASVLDHSAIGRYDAVIYDGHSMDEPAGGWPQLPAGSFLPMVAHSAGYRFSPWIDVRFLPSILRSTSP